MEIEMFNPDAKSPKLAPTRYEIDDFWFSAYRGLTIWHGWLDIEIDSDTGEWYLDGLTIDNGIEHMAIEKTNWLFQALEFELRQKEHVGLADRITEACLEAAESGI